VIALVDKDGNMNLVYWQSIKCHRITRSVLASELYALSLGFDNAATIRSTLNQIFTGSREGVKVEEEEVEEQEEKDQISAKIPATLSARTLQIPLTICVDSKSLYDCLIKLGTTQEKHLMINILYLRQSYKRQEIAEILWIKGEKNSADAMTKKKPYDALKCLIATNKVDLD